MQVFLTQPMEIDYQWQILCVGWHIGFEDAAL